LFLCRGEANGIYYGVSITVKSVLHVILSALLQYIAARPRSSPFESASFRVRSTLSRRMSLSRMTSAFIGFLNLNSKVDPDAHAIVYTSVSRRIVSIRA
jgi:hypothetical protein